jgi:hypothetical protein
MAMTVVIANAVGATPTWSTVGATTAKWNRVDTLIGTTVIPTPTSTGTNFSFIKTFMIEITVTDSLNMTDVTFGKVAGETTTGTKLWYTSEHAEGSYVEATTFPAPEGDNNVTAPNINGGSAEAAVPLISSGDLYAAGPFNSTGRKGNLIEICLGVDATNTTAGSTVATPTLRWQWTES